jgi:hypothetical protein
MAAFGIGTKGASIATARKPARYFGAANFKKLLNATVILLLL